MDIHYNVMKKLIFLVILCTFLQHSKTRSSFISSNIKNTSFIINVDEPAKNIWDARRACHKCQANLTTLRDWPSKEHFNLLNMAYEGMCLSLL